MSTLSFETLRMPAARLGSDNPLPPLYNQQNPINFKKISDIPAEIVEKFDYGFLPNNAPYTFQEDYSRQLIPTDFRVAVLENEILKAVFLIEFGGRLRSLFHKPSNRELLLVNPDFQLANLAIRNAWFCGGIEWNIGTIGHSPFTCSPLFTARMMRPDGTPVLRLYEWERFRQVPFQIDFYLPDESHMLYAHVLINNPNDHDVPMYWWSNIALQDEPGLRVIVPSDSALCLGCRQDEFIKIPIPDFKGIDITYPANIKHASDLFYEIQHNNRHWVTAVNKDGRGLVQISTNNLIGRKLWVWGSQRGGKNWQKFLSPGGKDYIEIQAGITRTQLEHKRLPGKAQLSWLEAYGLLEVDPEVAHGSHWAKVVNHVESELEILVPEANLISEYHIALDVARSPAKRILQLGSGWGALENHRREAAGEQSISALGTDFSENSLSKEQAPWINLINKGTFPYQDPDLAPGGYLVGEKWQAMLEEAIITGPSLNWFAYFHLGVMRHHAGDFRGAQTAWEHSVNLTWSAWAVRCLGIVAWHEGRFDEALGYLLAAYRSQPDLVPLAVECGKCMIEAEQYQLFFQFFHDLPTSMQTLGRMRLLNAQSA
ncbi:MAG: DUF5107 domain-containing protein, partial [Anaerolineales bacterium]